MAPALSRKIRLNRAGSITQCRDNGEARMTKQTPTAANNEEAYQRSLSFRFRHSFGLRHSSFVIYKVVAKLLTAKRFPID